MKKYILGFDTSAYTASVALIDFDGNVIYNLKKILDIPKGEKGLRQESALFLHFNIITQFLLELDIDYSQIKLVTVSAFPRNVEGSYMPVFLVGKNFAKIVSKSSNADYIEYSHQENHISAGLMEFYKNHDFSTKPFLALHNSGGTLELLMVEKSERGFKTEIVGGTLDITFGQLIDRIGVYLGYDFPCGRYMEESIDKSDYEVLKSCALKFPMPKISGKDFLNLSGIENYFKKIIDEENFDTSTIIYALFNYVSLCTVKIINSVMADKKIDKLVIIGGVASNTYIRNYLVKELSEKINLFFSDKLLSSDNAVGVAFLPLIDRWYNEIKAD